MLRLVTVLLLLLSAGIGRANDYYAGQSIRGYTYNSDGFWYKGGDTTCYYAVKKYEYAPYYDCYGRTQIYYSYEFYPVPTKTVTKTADYVPPKVSYTKGWKEELARAETELDDHAAFLLARAAHETRAAAFLPPPGTNLWYGYVNSTTKMPYADANVNLGSFGAQGQTVMGYSYRALAQNSSDDLHLLLQSYARTVGNSQVLAGQAQSDLASLTEQAQAAQAARIEALAKAEATVRLWTPSPVTRGEFKAFSFRTENGAIVPQGGIPPAQGSAAAGWQQSAQKCVKCHGANAPAGGFNVADFPSLPPDRKALVLQRLVHPDPKKLMPRGEDGIGHALPPSETAYWYLMTN